MYKPSLEAERIAEQAWANRRRLAAFRAKQRRLIVRIMALEDVPVHHIPDSRWFPAFLKPQGE